MREKCEKNHSESFAFKIEFKASSKQNDREADNPQNSCKFVGIDAHVLSTKEVAGNASENDHSNKWWNLYAIR